MNEAELSEEGVAGLIIPISFSSLYFPTNSAAAKTGKFINLQTTIRPFLHCRQA